MFKIALIGCGEHSGEVHGPSLGRHAKERGGEIKLVAACDINLERAQGFCRDFGFAKAYQDYHQMLEQEMPDGVVMIVPASLVVAAGSEMMQRGIPCVVEKPIGVSIEETRALAAVAKKTGTMHMVSVNRRFLPPLNKAIQWAAGQGALRCVKGSMLRIARKEKDFAWGTGLHLVDALRHIGGDVTEFNVVASGKENQAGWYCAAYRYASGVLGMVDILPTAGFNEEIFELMGDGFRVRVAAKYRGDATIQGWRDGKLVLDEVTDPTLPMFVLRGEYLETGEFLDALRDRRAAKPTIADVLPSAEFCARLQSRR